MPSILTCPDEAELLAVAAGDEVSDDVRQHLDQCPRCPELVQHYRALVVALRNGEPGASLVPSTASELTSDLAPEGGQANHAPAAASPEPAETKKPRTSVSETDLEIECTANAGGAAPLPAAIGKYLVIGRFPKSGQAEVYRVVHPGLAKDLVLKLSLNPISADGRCEIIEEAKLLADLKHPNLVQVYDLDFHDERPYLVMEFIRGRTLDQVAEGGMPRARPRRFWKRSPGRSNTRTSAGSSTATSSPRTSWSTTLASRG